MSGAWEFAARDYDELWGHGIQTAAEADCWRSLMHRLLPCDNPAILEVGAGTGAFTETFADLAGSILLTDPSPAMLAVAKERFNGNASVDFQLADALGVFSEQAVDVVVMRNVFWQLTFPEEAAARWLKILRPGGRLIIIDQLRLPVPWWRQRARDIADWLPGTSVGARHGDPRANARMPIHEQQLKRARSETAMANALTRSGYRRVTAERLEWIDDFERSKMPWIESIGRRWNRVLVTGDRD